ncbi:MAG: hypothetical protein JWP51_5401 [Bradyrhizobium sp.]|nr:hypothetical protein [Bradyrhizobium sp.]
MLRGTAGRRSKGNDDINLETHEFGGHGRELVDRSVRPPRLKEDVLSLEIAQFGKCLANDVKGHTRLRPFKGAADQEAYPRDFRCWLSARRMRPGRRGTKNCQEVASPHGLPLRLTITRYHFDIDKITVLVNESTPFPVKSNPEARAAPAGG